MEGEYAVDGFDVNAVGWVLTLNVRSLNQRERYELYSLWTEVLRAYAEDKSKIHPLLRLAMPRSIKLSEKSVGVFAKLVKRMTALHPESLGCSALRKRRNAWLLQSALSFLCCFLTANLLPDSFPLFREIVLSLFVMSLACLIPTVTLWRAVTAARHFSSDGG